LNKALKIVIIFLAVDAVAAGLYFGYKALSGKGPGPADGYPWVTVDENYQPRNSVEEYLKADAVKQGLLPAYIKDYGRNAKVLKKFRGSKLAGANEAVLNVTFPGVEDWMLVDLRYKTEKERDVQRTMLYVQVGGQWKVGDSGRLMK
jgi:hypothetical protein